MESKYDQMNTIFKETHDFRRKVEHALFTEEGHSRIRIMEEQNNRVVRAMFDEDEKSRIALMDSHIKSLLQLVDRGKGMTYVLWIGWIGLGALLGELLSFWLKR